MILVRPLLALCMVSAFCADGTAATSSPVERRLSQCEDSLRKILETTVGSPDPEPHLYGTIRDFGRLLRQRGFADARVQEFERVMAAVLRRKGVSPILEEVSQHFTGTKPNDGPVICFLAPDVAFSEGDNLAAYLPSDGNFILGDSTDVFQRPYPTTGLQDGLVRELDLMTFRIGDLEEDEVLLNLVASILHEYNHFMDMERISRWVQANQVLIEQGEEPDDYFKKYVRILDESEVDQLGGKILVSDAFFRFVTEARSYQLDQAIHRLLGIPSKFEQNYLLRMLLRIGEAEAAKFLMREGINVLNVFSRGLEASRLMDKTIRRAERKTKSSASEAPAKIGRNDPCPCGSGKKLKKCCG